MTPTLWGMRLFLMFILGVPLAGCVLQSPGPQKLALQGSHIGNLPAFVSRSPETLIEARALKIVSVDSVHWLLLLSIERLDGETPDVTAVFALEALMPYVSLSSDGPREEGYIPMSGAVFEALSKTGLEVGLQDGDNRLHTMRVPARTFSHPDKR